MNRPPARSENDTSYFAQRVEELRLALRDRDLTPLAELSGALGDGDRLRLPLLGRPLEVALPDLTISDASRGAPASLFQQALVLYYLHTADGAPLTGRWVALSELPDGRFYHAAYQGYSGKPLAQAFGADLPGFARAAAQFGGVPEAQGDAAYVIPALPRLPLLALIWQGDDEFPASGQILFDASASHYLPTDVLAILGGSLARQLTAARPPAA